MQLRGRELFPHNMLNFDATGRMTWFDWMNGEETW